MAQPTKRHKPAEVLSSPLPPSLSDAPLPRFIDLDSFVQARQYELNHFLSVLDDKSKLIGKTKHAFQLLPKHMRRRAMSHNTYRVPARVRVRQESEAQVKRSSRKRRRRTSQLLAAYMRRDRQWNWLETHIWHAKRMHMEGLWGYKLAVKPHEKGQRACYRFANTDSTLYDASYYVFLRLTASLPDFITRFTKETTTPASVSEGSTAWDTLLYSSSTLVGPITLFQASPLHLILLVHPSAYPEAKSLLSQAYPLEDLKDQLVYYRLRGPTALKVVMDSMRVENTPARELLDSAKGFNAYQFPANALIGLSYLRHQQKGPMHMPARARNCAQSSWVPAQPDSNLLQALIHWPKEISRTDLWAAVQERQVASLVPTKLTTRSRRCRFPKPNPEASVPTKAVQRSTQSLSPEDSEDEVEMQQPVIPALLLFRRSGMKRGLGSGWDLLAPSGYGTTLWRQLVYAGGKATGLREFEALVLEQGSLNFPNDYPTTRAYNDYVEGQSAVLKAKYDRTPSSHKVNPERIAFPTPFSPPWVLLSPIPLLWNQLIPIRLKAIRRRPAPNSLLCLPLPCDLEHRAGPAHQEPLHSRSFQSSSAPSSQVETACLAVSLEREVVGVVTSGSYSHARGKGYGVGFVLREKWNEELMLLFRRPQSRFYHLAEVVRLPPN